jgi:UDP-GlcNAc3NAcA epimerase
MKLLTIVGARPQFIKAAALSRVIRETDDVSEDILHTGQHYDANMSDVFFEELDIPKPVVNLSISGSHHGAMTGQMLAGIEEAIIERKPDVVLVYGDTNSTLAGALAAAKLHVPVAHVEAGLRSFNMKMPEEINRIVTDRISNWLFCPTETAIKNLKHEGFETFNSTITNVGDIMLDAALHYSKKNESRANAIRTASQRYILATIHRAENTDDSKRLISIFKQLQEIHNTVSPVVLPLHPRTRRKLLDLGFDPASIAIDPVGYLDMISLTQNAQAVVTDSGGLQKEAYFFKRPCVIVRDETEWTELVSCGAAIISPPDSAGIAVDLYRLTTSSKNAFTDDLYGNGKAGKKIVQALLSKSE